MVEPFSTAEFYSSVDVELDLKVYVGHLEGSVTDLLLPSGHLHKVDPRDLYVSAHVEQSGGAVACSSVSTQCASVAKGTASWKEWLTLPVSIASLDRSAEIVLTLWAPLPSDKEGVEPTLIAGAGLSVFDDRLLLRNGEHRSVLWPATEDEERAAAFVDSLRDLSADEQARLRRLRDDAKRGDLPDAPWLDRISYQAMEAWSSGDISPATSLAHSHGLPPADLRRGAGDPAQRCEWPSNNPNDPQPVLLRFYLPRFPRPVVFDERLYPAMTASPAVVSLAPSLAAAAPARDAAPPTAAELHALSEDENAPAQLARSWLGGAGGLGEHLLAVVDPEQQLDNPAATKYVKLTRGLLRELTGDLQPSRDELDEINAICALTCVRPLPTTASQLLWRFRVFCTTKWEALVPFLLCVDWKDDDEAAEALQLMARWQPIRVEAALRLLGPDFRNEAVRAHGVDFLKRCTDGEIEDYLLQLVQALRYEPGLEDVLRQRTLVRTRRRRAARRVRRLASIAVEEEEEEAAAGAGGGDGGERLPALPPLAAFLAARCGRNTTLAGHLFWYLTVETGMAQQDNRFSRFLGEFQTLLPEGEAGLGDAGSGCDLQRRALVEAGEDSRELSATAASPGDVHDALGLQGEMVTKVMGIVKESKQIKGNAQAKKLALRRQLAEGGALHGSTQFAPAVLPLDGSVHVSGVEAHSVNVFKSAIHPVLLKMVVAAEPAAVGAAAAAVAAVPPAAAAAPPSPPPDGTAAGAAGAPASPGASGGGQAGAGAAAAAEGEGAVAAPPASAGTYDIIVKEGDDLRQDQLIMQMIRLMDRTLKDSNVDLRLTPYRVLATEAEAGMMECVPDSRPINDVRKNILGFLQEHGPDPSETHGVQKDVMLNYVNSLAGYCVITYLLMVGDRHLDNILIQTSGKLLHIDFGFIFGKDPKPFPPPIKLTPQMIEGMGGVRSDNYRLFLRRCCSTYTTLRRSAGLYLNLLYLMQDANLDNMKDDPAGTVAKVEEKFRLEMSDAEAERAFLQVLDDSIAALFPHLADFIHNLATRMR